MVCLPHFCVLGIIAWGMVQPLGLSEMPGTCAGRMCKHNHWFSSGILKLLRMLGILVLLEESEHLHFLDSLCYPYNILLFYLHKYFFILYLF
jgi:hypothetical protein